MLQKFLNINRKLHIHLGLFILLFIWLFFVSGLILNHGSWKFARFYENRKENTKVIAVPMALLNDDADIIRQVESNLKIAGEVSGFRKDTSSIDFRVSSPGLIQEIHIDAKSGSGTMKETKYNFWGKLRTLHTFNGMDRNNPSVNPNWIITKFWRIIMDVTAVILILLCLGSWIMWMNVRKDYKLGYYFLAAGLLIAGYYFCL